MENLKCFICEKEIQDNEIASSEISAKIGNGNKVFNAKSMFYDHLGNGICLCKDCIVGTLAMSARSILTIDTDPEWQLSSQYIN